MKQDIEKICRDVLREEDEPSSDSAAFLANAAPALARECIRLQRRVEELGAKVVQMRSFMRNILDGKYTQTQLIEAAKISLGGVDSPKEPRQ